MTQWGSAFGIEPTESTPTAADRWARAVDLGARGYAAAARTIVDRLLREATVPAAVRSAALATRASLTRQAGGHAIARADDGAAIRAVAGDHGPWAVAARVDALIGLAADDLGVGDFTASGLLLDRAAAELGAAESSDWICVGRPRLRLGWVRTELALYTGDPRAAELAANARALSVGAPSARHRIKTDLIAAAASAAAGDIGHAADEAQRLAAACRTAGLLPLEWAAQTMVAGLRPAAIGDRPPDRLQEDLRRLGMAFRALPSSDVTDRYA
ncbi:hypothetical protein [Gordonia phthalatica]|uniref:Uncharacterized protein n=1 Tax=Gordonia phthalatica TaxID=1136941 RepID=A0A0N7FUF0_9ACTN|nr:hypothetical protein [Gordonia phthalatica]ALG84175.1 hypothetical protein ACH46_06210 [Gordonia phthalatica]